VQSPFGICAKILRVKQVEESKDIPNQIGDGSENVVYIGRKPLMTYVMAVVTQFSNGMLEVTIKARGNEISRAVDVKEIVVRKFLPALKVRGTTTSSEEMTNADGSRSMVSSIQITLAK